MRAPQEIAEPFLLLCYSRRRFARVRPRFAVRADWEFRLFAADTAAATENKRSRYLVMFTSADEPALSAASYARSWSVCTPLLHLLVFRLNMGDELLLVAFSAW